MALYVNYYNMAQKEGNLVQPIPAYEKRSKSEKTSTTQPPTPPSPKSPLELLEELKKENVKVIVDGKEIEYEAARKLFQKDTFSRIDVSKQEGRPVMRLWSE